MSTTLSKKIGIKIKTEIFVQATPVFSAIISRNYLENFNETFEELLDVELIKDIKQARKDFKNGKFIPYNEVMK